MVTTWIEDGGRNYRLLAHSQEKPAQWIAGQDVHELVPFSDPAARLYMQRGVTVVLPVKVWSPITTFYSQRFSIRLPLIKTQRLSCGKSLRKLFFWSFQATIKSFLRNEFSWDRNQRFPRARRRSKPRPGMRRTTALFCTSPTSICFDVDATRKIIPTQGLAKIALPKNLASLGVEI